MSFKYFEVEDTSTDPQMIIEGKTKPQYFIRKGIPPQAFVALQKFLDTAKPRHKKLFHLKFVKRLSFSKIGKELGISKQSAHESWKRLEAKLRKTLTIDI